MLLLLLFFEAVITECCPLQPVAEADPVEVSGSDQVSATSADVDHIVETSVLLHGISFDCVNELSSLSTCSGVTISGYLVIKEITFLYSPNQK